MVRGPNTILVTASSISLPTAAHYTYFTHLARLQVQGQGRDRAGREVKCGTEAHVVECGASRLLCMIIVATAGQAEARTRAEDVQDLFRD